MAIITDLTHSITQKILRRRGWGWIGHTFVQGLSVLTVLMPQRGEILDYEATENGVKLPVKINYL